MTTAALDLLAEMVLEDGSRWADRAAPFQWRAARAFLDPAEPPYLWDSRPRGGSKTTDAAGWCLSAMLAELPAGSRSYAFASDKDQARLLVDAAAGLVARTPEISGAFKVDSYKVTCERSGSVLEVLPADVASAYGLRPSLVIADEVCQWPIGQAARGLWEAVLSAMPKVPGARLACITTSGDPSHWTRKAIFEPACRSPRWSVLETPGPLPWVGREALEEQREMLPDSAFARLHLNQWAEAEDRLVSIESLREAAVLAGPIEPVPGVLYRMGVDVGLRNDRTAICVVHGELMGEAVVGRNQRRRVVLDRIVVLRGSRRDEVAVSKVEEMVAGLSRAYNGALVRLDPFNAIGVAQQLRRVGVVVEEYSYSDARYAQSAAALMTLLREGRLLLPDDDLLLDELATVRLKQTRSGQLRMDHDPGRHDDQVQALGFAVTALLETSGWSSVRLRTPAELERERRALRSFRSLTAGVDRMVF